MVDPFCWGKVNISAVITFGFLPLSTVPTPSAVSWSGCIPCSVEERNRKRSVVFFKVDRGQEHWNKFLDSTRPDTTQRPPHLQPQPSGCYVQYGVRYGDLQCHEHRHPTHRLREHCCCKSWIPHQSFGQCHTSQRFQRVSSSVFGRRGVRSVYVVPASIFYDPR